MPDPEFDPEVERQMREMQQQVRNEFAEFKARKEKEERGQTQKHNKKSDNYRIYEYCSKAVPENEELKPEGLLPPHRPELIREKYGVDDLDSNAAAKAKRPLKLETPNLMATYLEIKARQSLDTGTECSQASSNVFYVVKGRGKTVVKLQASAENREGKIPSDFKQEWSAGDVLTLPYIDGFVFHMATEDSVLFYANDAPLLAFLASAPSKPRFTPTYFAKQVMLDHVKQFNDEAVAAGEERNRNGILLSNEEMAEEKLFTITHTMWSLLNQLPANTVQKPHRHQSIAIDLCVDCGVEAEMEEKVYTLMGPELVKDEHGAETNEIKDPIKMLWKKDCTFTTPPGWWHAHVNESDTPAWVFPVQDAGLHTHLRSLDIRFRK